MQTEKIELFVPGHLCLFGEHSDWVGLNISMNAEIIPGCAIVTGIEQGIYGTAGKSEMFMVTSRLLEYQGETFSCEMDMGKLRVAAICVMVARAFNQLYELHIPVPFFCKFN